MNSRGLAVVTAASVVLLSACQTPRESTPSPTGTPTSSAATPSGAVDLDRLSSGPAPTIAWAQDRLLNGEADAKELPAGVDEFTRTKQLLVSRDKDGHVYAYAPEGPIGTTPIGEATGRLAVNKERNLVAWVAPDGSPTVLQEGQARPVVLQNQAGVTSGDAVAVVGHDCFNGPETVEGAGCSVYFRSTGTDTPRSFVASNHGFVDELGTAPYALQDVGGLGEVGWTELKDDQTTCSTFRLLEGTLGPSGLPKPWTTCTFMPLQFSPDGTRVLATGSQGYEGRGASELAILKRTGGKPVLRISNDQKSQAAIVDMTWEDNKHVLAVVNQGLDWAIVRVGIDGSMELAGPRLRPKAELDDIPLRLAVQP